VKLIGVGFICARHSEDHDTETQLCRFPEARGGTCHQCGVTREHVGTFENDAHRKLYETSVGFCSNDCGAAWDNEHPGYWTPIEDTFPGGPHDGVWENSGFEIRP
jgi:hypothetical protein